MKRGFISTELAITYKGRRGILTTRAIVVRVRVRVRVRVNKGRRGIIITRAVTMRCME